MATDYAALLKDAITQKKSDSYIQTLAAARNAKQASDPNYSGMQSTQSYMDSLGYKPQTDYAQNISDMIKSNADPYAVIAEGNKRDKTISDNNMTQGQYGTLTADLYKSLGFDPSKYKPQTAPTAPAYQAPQAIDNSGMINTQYGDLITALKAQIQQGVNNKNMTISGLGDKYQPDKNASEVAKYGQVASLNEQAANAGDRGGIGRQNTLAAMVGGENRLNTINLQQSGEKATLQNDIANLMLEGNVQEAQFSAQKLKDLIANNTNMDNTNYSRGMDTANLTGLLGNGQKTMAAQQIDTQNSQWQQGFDTQNSQWDKTYAMDKSAADLNNQLTRLSIDTSTLNLAALPQQIQDQATQVTQQIIKGDIDIETGRAQLKELTDPNSITNQMNRLGLDTANFNYSQLSVTAQQLAAQVANDLANGVMSRASAQSSINHAGDSYAASIASTNASAAANAAQQTLDQAKFDYSKTTPADMTDAQIIDSNTGYIVGVMNGYSTNAEKLNYLQSNSTSIINDIGYDVYSKLVAGLGG